MKIIDDILQHIAYSIANNEYVWTDPEKVAIKNNSHVASDWSDVFISTNAFLNTNGGTIIIGIEDDESNSQYIFKGFDFRNEEKIRLLTAAYTNIEGEPKELTDHLTFELKPFLDGQVLAIHITPLADEQKYAYYKGTAYERLITGDHRIQSQKTADEAIQDAKAKEVKEPTPQSTNIKNEESPSEEKPQVFQKLFSAELITLFGADYISLEPDYKQMLAFIYERNNFSEDKYPKPNEICIKLWAVKGAVNNIKEYALYEKKMKKAIALLEKNGLILRNSGKQEYLLNTNYHVATNLFS